MRKRTMTVYEKDYIRFRDLKKKYEEKHDEKIYSQWLFEHILDVYEKSLVK